MFEIASKKLGLEKVVLGVDNGKDESKDKLNKEVLLLFIYFFFFLFTFFIMCVYFQEIEKLLRVGAYHLLQEGEGLDDKSFDLDAVLSSATTLTEAKPTETLNALNTNFSKAIFLANEKGMLLFMLIIYVNLFIYLDNELDLNDANFWTKLLDKSKNENHTQTHLPFRFQMSENENSNPKGVSFCFFFFFFFYAQKPYFFFFFFFFFLFFFFLFIK
jgi:hypothetical protein